MSDLRPDDAAIIQAINRRTDAGLTIEGRAEFGQMAGAIFVRWPDGRDGVVTQFHGSHDEAQRVAGVLNPLRDKGLPVPRHELVVDLGERVVFVQERLPQVGGRRVTPARVDAIADVNERFAGVLISRPDVPLPPMCTGGHEHVRDVVTTYGSQAIETVDRLVEFACQTPPEMARGTDLVHTDLSAANVLMDENNVVTGVVDWNLGAYRGDRHFALIAMRFDREWFVRSPSADAIERASAARLDEIIEERVTPALQRIYWAQKLAYRLPMATRLGDPVVQWHLELATERVLADRGVG